MELDELNVLSDSGGGGGAGGMDYGSMFEEMQLDSDFAKWIDQIKEAIANGDWAGVGKILGDKVNELIDKVDFAGIGDKLGYKRATIREFMGNCDFSLPALPTNNKTPGRAYYSTRCFVVCPNRVPIKNRVFGLSFNGGA